MELRNETLNVTSYHQIAQLVFFLLILLLYYCIDVAVIHCFWDKWFNSRLEITCWGNLLISRLNFSMTILKWVICVHGRSKQIRLNQLELFQKFLWVFKVRFVGSLKRYDSECEWNETQSSRLSSTYYKVHLLLVNNTLRYWKWSTLPCEWSRVSRLNCMYTVTGGESGKEKDRVRTGGGDRYRVLLLDAEHHTETFGKKLALRLDSPCFCNKKQCWSL